MPKDELFQETVTRVKRPSAHFTLLRAPDGEFLGASDNALATFDYVDDKAIWEQVEGSHAYRHVVIGLVLEAESADSANGCYLRHDGVWLASNGTATNESVMFSSEHGLAYLPSEYLESFKQNGWVCLPAIMAPGIVEELERISCTGC